jgi:hypothetical protein
VSLRNSTASADGRPGGEANLVHLANDRSSLEANQTLQNKTANLLCQIGVDDVIIPMSFATLQKSGARAGDPQAANLGFETPYLNTYIAGKLAAEEFWTAWQAEDPTRRRVAFVYVPTILGPHSAWSRISGYRPDTRIWVPDLPRFFSVTEERLAQTLIELCRRMPSAGVSRMLLYDRSGSLAEAILWERGPKDVRELRCPNLFWRALVFGRHARVNILLTNVLRAMNLVLSRTLRQTVLPVDPLYCALFRSQAGAAAAIEDAARRLAGAQGVPAPTQGLPHAKVCGAATWRKLAS